MNSPHPEHDAYVRGIRHGILSGLWITCVLIALGTAIYSIVVAV